ncbi:MAG: ABC transporter permease subunit [Candidatus Poribacteria bacterium]|nr:ABC transporter permease subunit [Candidatus Poribacteria bacterium]
MILHIIKRELFDHINSLRFVLTTVILLVLMFTNAWVHIKTHPENVRRYSNNITRNLDQLKDRAELYTLIRKGPGNLYKSPASLSFIADGDDAYLPSNIYSPGSWSKSGFGGRVRSNWWISYGSVNPDAKDLRPQATKIDWVFIITYLLSLIPLLFTFDSFSGERERGTLRLCLANPISRPTLLVGKFLGTLIAILIPFVFAVLVNLTVISTDSWTQLNAMDWGRLGIILLIAVSYAGIFIGLGLMISAGTREPRLSLIVVLLIWVTAVVFVPSTLGTLSTKWMPPLQTNDQFQAAKKLALDENDTDYNEQIMKVKQEKLSGAQSKLQQLAKMSRENVSPEDIKAAQEAYNSVWQKDGNEELQIKSEFIKKDVEIRERFNRSHLDAQTAQIRSARAATRFSPAAIVQYALESMAGTGFNRHLQFLDNVHLYKKQFRQFIVDIDRTDNESLHLIGIPEGMSKKTVTIETIPKFEDKITFKDTFNSATLDLLLLVLLLVVFFSGAFLVFLRTEV